MTQWEGTGLTYLQVDKLSKSFGGFKALSDVSLSVRKGEIRAVLGENGAGKTTLMNVIYGLYRPDSGQITIDGNPVELHSPADAIRHRIGMIHQHFHLANALTVVENIVLGLGGARANLRFHAKRIAALSEEYGFDIDPHAPVWKLPLGMRQRVEILKALYRDAEILVLDEPTSVLAPDEISGFLRGLELLRARGHTILFVTHKLDEVMAVSDSVTVMRRGRTVETIDARTSSAELAPVDIAQGTPAGLYFLLHWLGLAAGLDDILVGPDEGLFVVAIDGDRLVVGARHEDGCGTGVNPASNPDGCDSSGAAYIFERTNGVWAQTAMLKASNPGAGDQFGIPEYAGIYTV